MSKKKEVHRPNSYKLNEFSAEYLRMFADRLADFINATNDAFEHAATAIAAIDSEQENEDDRHPAPLDLQNWLILKKGAISEFATKVEVGERNLKGKPLSNLRQVRAFFSRFESVAKHQYGSVSMFESVDPKLAKILLEKFVPARNEGGIFEISRHLLRGEELHSIDDLGEIRNSVKVGKTITYIVAAQIKLKENPITGEVDDLAHPSDNAPAAIAATPRTRKDLAKEFDLDDPRRKKPTKPACIKARKNGDKNQPELGLS